METLKEGDNNANTLPASQSVTASSECLPALYYSAGQANSTTQHGVCKVENDVLVGGQNVDQTSSIAVGVPISASQPITPNKILPTSQHQMDLGQPNYITQGKQQSQSESN